MTTLTERYLAAALRGIPERQRGDVERELSSAIADAVEDRVAAGEERKGAETAVLDGLGDPARLAAGITGRPAYLIGPDLFFEYQRVLVSPILLAVPIVGLVRAAIEVGNDAAFGTAILEGLGAAITVGVHLFFWVTLMFVIAERTGTGRFGDVELRKLVGGWSVERLPEPPSPNRVGLGETVGEVATLLLTMGGLFVLRGFSSVRDDSGAAVGILNPTFQELWVPALIAVLGLLVILRVVILRVGRWTMPLASAHAVLEVAFSGPVIALALTGSLINPAFAEAVGWPPLADGDGVVMLSVAVGVLLVTAWETFDAFRRARHP